MDTFPSKTIMKHSKCLVMMITLIVFQYQSIMGQLEDWPKVGCHRVSYTRKVQIPDCIEFSLTTNACRGFCESFAVPSSFAIGAHRPTNNHQPVTSVGQCCNIMDSEEVKVKVLCLNGIRDVNFKSATNCSCFHCKKL